MPLNGTPGADWLHTDLEASRLAFADRAQYLADPDFVAAPAGHWGSLLQAHYVDERARLIMPTRSPQVGPGQPGGTPLAYAPMPEQPEYGTSHMSIIDRFGHDLAMTTTIKAGFGSRLRERGHTVNEAAMTSGLQALQGGRNRRWLGGADPRRKGIVVGD